MPQLGKPTITWSAPRGQMRYELARGRHWHDRIRFRFALWLLAHVDYEPCGYREFKANSSSRSAIIEVKL